VARRWWTAVSTGGGFSVSQAPMTERRRCEAPIVARGWRRHLGRKGLMFFSFVVGPMDLSIAILGQNTGYAAAHPAYPVATPLHERRVGHHPPPQLSWEKL
jgi:hypothetical protein